MITSTEVLWRLECALKPVGNIPVSSYSLLTMEKRDGKYIRWFHVYRWYDVDTIMGKLFELSLGNFISDVKIPYFVSGQHCSIDFIFVESDDGETNIDESVIEAVGKLKWKNNS